MSLVYSKNEYGSRTLKGCLFTCFIFQSDSERRAWSTRPVFFKMISEWRDGLKSIHDSVNLLWFLSEKKMLCFLGFSYQEGFLFSISQSNPARRAWSTGAVL